jgi:sulfur transfer complex TusBCD TusB component (DsrH family)
VSEKHGRDSQNAKGQTGDKLCLVTIDTGLSVTMARPDITAGLTKSDLIMPYILQIASGDILPILKEALVKLTLGHHPQMTWVFVNNITYEFILVWMSCAPMMHL